MGLWILGLAVSNIYESQLQTYESKTLFLMISLQYYCIPGLSEIKTYAQKMQDAQVKKSLLSIPIKQFTTYILVFAENLWRIFNSTELIISLVIAVAPVKWPWSWPRLLRLHVYSLSSMLFIPTKSL